MKKQGVITFKVDEGLLQIIRDIPNRSEFIRCAILSALGSTCPLCNGTGILTPNQKGHWEDFCANHTVQTCSDCRERYLVCMTGQQAG
ncbi:MAG TPA: CopG family transcriptional regulator [Deltaproteobacteria bacterium]|nr:CopG family transcriptional regulator [Deltaproteobacteria bacterium]HQI82755.1 CopG family transcriptional regulator [Deltaproteobacteria bacterium]